MNYPENLESKLGFDKIRELLQGICQTELAREESQIFPFSDQAEEVSRWLAETREFTELLDFEKSFEWSTPNDLRKEIKRAGIPGTFLGPETFIDIRNNYKAVSGVLRFFSKTRPEQYPALKAIVATVKVFPFVLEKIDLIFNKQGGVKDSASKELASIRVSIAQKTQGVSKRMQQIVDKARREGWIEQDTAPSMREGRLVVPLPVTHKRRINGLIHDESASGKTVYVEPVELIELNNEIRELEIAENREVIKILIRLTDEIRPYFAEILTWPELIGHLDFIRAKAVLSKRWQGVWIDISSEMTIQWVGARHPLLVMSFQKLNRQVVPQDIRLDTKNRILLISGPNAGGKSVCLKTTGLVQYLIQTGLLPPLEEVRVSGLFKEIFIDIGDDQSIENDLSTYSSHLHNMKHFVKNARPETLLLIDEFGTGTEPQLGAAIAEAILGQLNLTGAYGVITTHYSNLKPFAASQKGIINGAMLYDAQHMKPLFRLEIGKPGSSFAFEIAHQIGLPEEILNYARNQVGSDYIQFDKHLREISRDKRYWEKKRAQIRQQEKSLEKVLSDYERLVKEFEKEKKARMKQVQTDADVLMSQINKKIENTIQNIRQVQAEKEKTRESRKEIDDYVHATRKNLKEQLSQSDKNLQKIRQEHQQIRGKHIKDIDPKADEASAQEVEYSRLVPGVKVRVTDSEAVGEVMKVNKKSALVTIGDLMTTIPHDQLTVISEKEFQEGSGRIKGSRRSSWRDMEEKRLSFSPHIDLRGVRAEEALGRIQELLDQAVMFDEKHLRILHGKGNGILREMIRQFLASSDLVKNFRDEDVRFGGSGITLVDLEF